MNEVKFKANKNEFDSFAAAVVEEFQSRPVLPTPTVDDAGMIPTVNVDSSGEEPVITYELEDRPILPTPTADDGGKSPIVVVSENPESITYELEPLARIRRFSVPKSGSVQFDPSESFRAMAVTIGDGANQRGVYLLRRQSASTLGKTDVKAASDITITISDGVMTVANGNSSYIVYVQFFLITGDIEKHEETP